MQSIPLAASAITGLQIRNGSVGTVAEAFATVPGVVAEAGSTYPQLSVRGIFTDPNNIGLENSIGLYIDGVYQCRIWSFNNLIMDVERVEVLRGPFLLNSA